MFKFCFFLFFLFFLSLNSYSWANNYYLDSTNGNDNNPGTIMSPWKTIARAHNTLKASEFLYLNCGSVFNETLAPISGSIELPTAYKSYGSGEKPIITNFNAENKSNIFVEGIEFRSNNYSPAVRIYNSNYIQIKNCNIYADTESTTWSALYILMNSHHNSIIKCNIEHRNTSRQADAINLRDNADFNLLKANKIGMATHYSLSLEGAKNNPSRTANYNIISQNTIHNPFGAMVAIQSNSDYNLIEKNVISGGKSTIFCANLPRTLKLITKNNIVRNNILKDNPDQNGSGLSLEVYTGAVDNIATGNHIYNNVIHNISKHPLILGNTGSSICKVENNIFKNNIVYLNGSNTQFRIRNQPNIQNNFFITNIFFNTDSIKILDLYNSFYSVSEIQSSKSINWTNNMQNSPGIDDSLVPIDSTSTVVDKGTFLTNVNRNIDLPNNIIPVSDAGYFTDGFGVTEGDSIMVGKNEVKILKIDHEKNTIWVDQSISCKLNDPVSLFYKGSSPDIGAYEFGSPNNDIQPPTNFRIVL